MSESEHLETTRFSLAGMGLSKLYTISDLIGKPEMEYVIAPELVQNQLIPASDIWSIGAVAFMTITGHPIFEETGSTRKNVEALINDDVVFREREWAAFPNLRPIVERMLVKDASARPTAAELLTEPGLRTDGQGPIANAQLKRVALQSLSTYKTGVKLKHAISCFIVATMVNNDEVREL
jgi:serine/threonine protein kinase